MAGEKRHVERNHENAEVEQLAELGVEQNEKIREDREKEATRAEQAAERRHDAESAKHEALDEARKQEQADAVKEQPPTEKQPTKPLNPSKEDLSVTFKATMSRARKNMTPAERTFSKVIHNPAVEKVSDAVGSTLARPNLIIAGGLGTLIFGVVIYLTAKHYGYVLSGFEAIGTFILGWCIGAIIEFARVGFANSKQRP